MDDIVSFGEWVQQRRNQLRYTRSQFARLVGCAPVTVKKIERDERKPSLEIAELLAKHLQIPEPELDSFIRRARGEFVPTLLSPKEMTLAEAQEPASAEDTPKHNLPAQTTTFFGREQEIADIREQLANPACRLLTILGAGGMGKTRLSIEVGQRHASALQFTDGITYVSLAPIGENSSQTEINPLAGALADALKISFHAQGTPEEQLFTYLRRKEMLIIFDNFEHLLETAVFLSHLLQHAPDIKILTTSRERLNLQEEWLFALHGLSYSEDGTSAMQLFAQRAKQVQASFDVEGEKTAVLRICQLVEGMPLGLELAASWVIQLTCQEIADEIEAELDFLTSQMRNVPERQRSIRAVFSHSWEKLTDKEQSVLQKLSVFREGFDRQAAKAVAEASLPILARLVDQSLVSVGENGRYAIHELLRQFAAEKLAESGNKEGLLAEHSRYFLTFVAEQETRLKGTESIDSLIDMERDIDNVRAAVYWAVDHERHLFNKAVGFSLWGLYEVRGWFREGEAIFQHIAASLKADCMVTHPEQMTTSLSPRCLNWVHYNVNFGFFQLRLGKVKEAGETVQQGLSLLPAKDAATRWVHGLCLTGLGSVGLYKPEYARSERLLYEGSNLFKAEGDSWYYGMSMILRAQTMNAMGNYQEAQQLIEEAERDVNTFAEPTLHSYLLNELGRLSAHRGELAQAKTYHQAALTQRTKLENLTGTAFTLRDLGLVNRLQGNYEAAQRYYGQSVTMANEINMLSNAHRYVWELGNLALAKEDFVAAKRYFQESGRAALIGGLGWAALGLNEISKAKKHFQASLQKMLDSEVKPIGLDALVGMAHVGAKSGRFHQALACLALVQHHPASNWEVKEKARKLWEELTAELPPELVAEAEARGRELDLWETAVSLLAEKDNV